MPTGNVCSTCIKQIREGRTGGICEYYKQSEMANAPSVTAYVDPIVPSRYFALGPIQSMTSTRDNVPICALYPLRSLTTAVNRALS
jgi:hypothetical protein